MTMLALVLMVGIVIDDAIVVLENTFRFVEEKRMEPKEAARHATAEIGLAVLATTLSLVVIFVPVSFMSSIAGRFLYQFGITAAVAILVSLFVSFSLTPMMASRMFRPAARGDARAGTPPRRRARGFYRLIDWTFGGHAPVRRCATGSSSRCSRSATIATSGPAPPSRRSRSSSPPTSTRPSSRSQVNAPEGTSMPAMDAAMLAVEERDPVDARSPHRPGDDRRRLPRPGQHRQRLRAHRAARGAHGVGLAAPRRRTLRGEPAEGVRGQLLAGRRDDRDRPAPEEAQPAPLPGPATTRRSTSAAAPGTSTS